MMVVGEGRGTGDFFLWGWAKEEVYKTKPQTIPELKERIFDVLGNVLSDFFKKDNK